MSTRVAALVPTARAAQRGPVSCTPPPLRVRQAWAGRAWALAAPARRPGQAVHPRSLRVGLCGDAAPSVSCTPSRTQRSDDRKSCQRERRRCHREDTMALPRPAQAVHIHVQLCVWLARRQQGPLPWPGKGGKVVGGPGSRGPDPSSCVLPRVDSSERESRPVTSFRQCRVCGHPFRLSSP